jgi:hypothetical protein
MILWGRSISFSFNIKAVEGLHCGGSLYYTNILEMKILFAISVESVHVLSAKYIHVTCVHQYCMIYFHVGSTGEYS